MFGGLFVFSKFQIMYELVKYYDLSRFLWKFHYYFAGGAGVLLSSCNTITSSLAESSEEDGTLTETLALMV